MSNIQYGKSQRTIHVSNSGDDAYDGLTPITAKKTINSAVTAVMALVPPPELFNPAAITGIDGGRYVENIVIPDNVQLFFGGCAIQGVGGTVIKAGANAQAEFLTISTSQASGDVAYDSNGKSRVSLDSRAIILNGPDQVGCLMQGVTDQAFQNIGQIAVRFNNSKAVSLQSTGDSPRYFQYNEINLNGDNSIAFNCDTVALTPAAFRVGAITYESVGGGSTGVGNVAFNIVKGSISGYCAEIECEALSVVGANGDFILDTLLSSGAIDCEGKQNISSRRHTGDIVNSGYTTITVDEHVSGIISNSAALNGQIDFVRYGTWELDGDYLASVFRAGNIPSSFDTFGFINLDGNTDSITSLTVSYTQSTNNSRTIDFQLIDLNTSTVYYSGSNTGSGIGVKSFQATNIASLPLSSLNLAFQIKDSGGQVSDASANLYFTRTP